MQNRTKKELRKELSERSRSLSREYVKTAGTETARRLLDSGDFKKAASVFIYISVNNEPDTSEIIKTALACGKRVYVPKCSAPPLMSAVRIGEKTVFSENRFGIKEPVTGETARPEEIGLAVVPCVSAAENGARLGHGGGYYDRFLSNCPAKKICLCFEKLLLPELPYESTDVFMDKIITENRIITPCIK